jgi:aconitate hydratase
VDIDLTRDPLGRDPGGKEVYLRDLWPSASELEAAQSKVSARLFREQYSKVFDGDQNWRSLDFPKGETFAWDAKSTYVKDPPYFKAMTKTPAALGDIRGARVLLMVGDSVTTDHISPAGSIAKDSPAAKYLMEHGVKLQDFNSYGARRGNHEVMMRGTFANIRLKNLMLPGTEGGVTRHLPGNQTMPIFDVAMKYAAERVPLIVIAGKEYGSGSSRDWAAKGPALLGVRAVIAESYERIHRSNLVGMGVLPLEFKPGESRSSLGLTGEEVYEIEGLTLDLKPRKILTVRAKGAGGEKKFQGIARIDTPAELSYFQHGGILPFVLRQILSS